MMDPVLRLIIIIASIIVVLIILFTLVGITLIKKTFTRQDFVPGKMFLSYDDIKDTIARTEFKFKSGKNTLAGYIYAPESNETIIYVHGMCAGHMCYLSDIIALVNKGYKVITYDYTGTGSSTGKYYKGLAQQKYDLIALFNYLNNNPYFLNQEYNLYGHSMGGYAVSGVASKFSNIKRIVSISGFNNPHKFFIDCIRIKTNKLISILMIIPLRLGLFFLNGFKYNEEGIKCINKSNKDILVIHGKMDEIVPLKYSIYNSKDKCTNKNAKFILMEEEYHNKHNTVIASTDCVKYQEEIEKLFNEEIKKTNDKSIAYKNIMDAVDRFKFNVANDELIDVVDKFYRE